MSRPTMTDRLLGLQTARARTPNTYPFWRYLLIFGILVLGIVYAMPNMFPPDYALQIRPEVSDRALSPEALERATEILEAAGIEVLATEFSERDILIRVPSAEAQLQGRTLLNAQLNQDASGRRYVVALNLASTTPEWLRALGGKPMSYGLDLSGGVHFLLEVDMDRAIEERMRNETDTIAQLLREERLRYVPAQDWVQGTRVSIAFYDEETREAARQLLAERYGDFLILPRDVSGRPGLWLTMREEAIRQIEDYAVTQNLQSLRNRVNELGVSEPLVQRLGRDRIVVDLPGIQDSAEAKRILNKFANLQFRLVAPPNARPAETETYQYEGRTVTLVRSNIVTGENVTNAAQDYDPETGLPQVSITLDGAGGDRMHAATKDNVGQQMAIIFIELKPRTRTVMQDGEQVVEHYSEPERRLISVATIQSALGYRFRITGLDIGEARDLALLLRAGALAAPMYIVEERTVGASLGEENIERGTNAAILGLVLVVVYMLVTYKLFGLLANVALALNMVLLVAVMSILGATLTMPGIAGIVLTMGMAVDANIIVFSRIREELANRGPQAAIHAGFERAFLTVLDANITTFFIAVILFAIGSGPVKGFAVTLAIGIVTSVFTAITVTRAFVNLAYGGRNVKTLSI